MKVKHGIIEGFHSLPLCQGFWSWTDCGNEFDCLAFEDGSIICENCLCNWYQTGGLYYPGTNLKLREDQALLMFGPQFTDEELLLFLATQLIEKPCSKCGNKMTSGAPHDDNDAYQWECGVCGNIVGVPAIKVDK